MFRNLCFKRRFNIYLKCIGIASLIIFYFAFLFRESLHAIEISKNGKKNEIKQKIIITKRIAAVHPQLFNYDENKRKHLKIHKKNDDEEKSHGLYDEDKKRFIIDEIEQINEETSINPNKKLITSTLNPVYEYSEELQCATEKDLIARKQHMLKVCSKQNLFGIHPPKPKEFFVSQGHNLVWCNVFKAASSTWMYYFNILGGYDIKYLQHTKISPLELARNRFPRPKISELNEVLSTALSFLIVREPFERLLSAYRDKLEECHNFFYSTLRKRIIKRFRKKSQSKRYRGGPTFKEFLLFLIESYRIHKPFDEHWTPIYNFCTPCSINFTLIAKIETFQRDAEYIIRQAGLEPLLLNKMPIKRMKTISNHSFRNTSSLIQKYFSKIDRKTLNDLLKIYRLDFELFGYDYKKYYDIVQPSPEYETRQTSTTPHQLSSVSSVNLTTTEGLS